jgi:DNA-binding Lrp family transcriptional regulator
MKVERLGNLKYDYLDLAIVESLGKLGPRNIYKISQHMAVPESTIRYRISKLRSQKLLYLHTNVYHTHIGLKKGVVFIESNPIYARHIYEFLACNQYWIHMKKTHGSTEGCWCLYTIPHQYTNELKIFLDNMKDLDIISNYELYWSTCFHWVNPSTNWFDLKDSIWRFNWDGLLRDFDDAGTSLPLTLKDPDGFPILCDETDLFILKELEKDATIPLKDIADKMGTSTQNLFYHYKHHIMKNYLIEDFQVAFVRFDPKMSVMPIFLIDFARSDYLAKMANALRDKPFVDILGKILSRNILLMIAYLPINEFFNMLDTFNKLAEVGIVRRYRYYLQSFMEKGRRDVIPYQLFKEKRWIYDHEKYLARLHEKLKEVNKKIGG